MKYLHIICGTLLGALPMVVLVAISASCKHNMPIEENNTIINAKVRIVAIDSTTNMRTEDKILSVNVK